MFTEHNLPKYLYNIQGKHRDQTAITIRHHQYVNSIYSICDNRWQSKIWELLVLSKMKYQENDIISQKKS